MKYKETLNTPSTKFPMKAGLVENKKKFKDFWAKNEIYIRLNERISSKNYVLHDGPPYANGHIHVGHALNKILKDFVLRYKALTGHRIDYIPGWDTHGLPIENKLEKEGKYENKNIQEKRMACKGYASEQIQIQKSQFEKLHLVCDFKKIYRTFDPSFINKELEIFHTFIEKNLIYWDLKPVAWSWSSKTALAESEIIYKEVKCKSIEFWFPTSCQFKEIPKDARFLVWTTTPYTLEANLALCVNPEYSYELVEHEGHLWISIRGNLEGKVIKTFSGEYLEGAKYLNPITKEENQVILGNHVTDDAGTGIVHTAPGFGLEDFQVCQKYSIPTYSPILDSGKFPENTKFPPINNLFYTKASEVVINWLEKNGYLFSIKEITHRAGHDWRTEKPLIYRASPQWFVNIETLKPRIKECIRNIESNPPWLKQKLESLILARNEWCISRQRCWGTPIPILFDDNIPILDPKQILHTINLLRDNGVESWYEKEASFFLLPGSSVRGEIKKSTDILDVWFDSGCSWSVLEGQSIDLYLEGFDQLRGWFNSSSIVSVAKTNNLPFKKLMAHGFVLDGNGNKMSKSKGNVIDPMEIADKYGADILRLWLGMSNYFDDVKLSDSSLENTIKTYRKVRNTLLRYSLSVLKENFKFNEKILKNLTQPENIYIHSLFQNSYRKMINHLENNHFCKAIQENLTFLNTYSSWYLEICKDTLYCGDIESNEYQEIVNIIYEIFRKSTIFYSIFIPQTAEEAYGYIDRNQESVVLESLPEPQEEYPIDPKWEKFFEIRDEVYAQLENLKNQGEISSPQEATVEIDREIESMNLKKYLNVGQIIRGKKLKVYKCPLEKCPRCNRHAKEIKELCPRCSAFIEKTNYKDI